MTDEEMTLTRRIQLKELEIIKVFQDICKRHNLRYFAIGGTCLGAVRHKGFIPWDDDVDFAMPYEDYVKFLELCNVELPKSYSILTPSNSKRFTPLSYYSKIHDVNTTFTPSYYVNLADAYRGIFIEIFPVHGLPINEREKRKILLYSCVYKKLNAKLRFPFSMSPSAKGKILWLLSSPLKFFMPYYYFTSKHEKMMSRYPFGCSDEVIFPWRDSKPNKEGWYKNIFPYKYFKSVVEIPFEDITISVPVDYDGYLRSDFGDYMKLPPEDQRIGDSKGAIIDFDKPYSYHASLKED